MPIITAREVQYISTEDQLVQMPTENTSTEGQVEKQKFDQLPCLRNFAISIVIVKLNSRDI
jgi:hypothetical protein